MSVEFYKRQADDALERRSGLVRQAKSVDGDPNLSAAEKRSRIERLNTEIDHLTTEARSYIERAEREAETRRLAAGSGALFASADGNGQPSNEWRSILPSASEWRDSLLTSTDDAGGVTVPTGISKQVIEMLRGKSVFMKAPGLNLVPFGGGSFVLPQVSGWSDPGVTAEGAQIAEGAGSFTGARFDPIKYADLRRASSELLADSAVDMRGLIASEMLLSMSRKVDVDAFGGGDGSTALKGLTAAGMSTMTNLTGTQVTWDDVIDAFADVIAHDATPTVIWCSANQYKGLLRERTNVGGAGTGNYLAGDVTSDPARAALGLPILVSSNLPPNTVIVADASRVYVGVREGAQIYVTQDAYFSSDEVGYRITQRLAGLVVAEATSVQTLVAAAA